MSKQHRPKAVYAPGELDKTRKNLGNLSRQEAEQLAKRMGGEVGVERTAEKIETHYERLKDRARYKSSQATKDSSTPRRRRSQGAAILNGSKVSGSAKGKSAYTYPSPDYRNFVRMNREAAKADHGLKDLNLFQSNFLVYHFNKDDLISAAFIKNADSLFFSSLQNMVQAVKYLLKVNEKNKLFIMRDKFAQEILYHIADWDINGISADLSKLQGDPRNITFRQAAGLCRKIYLPLIILSQIHTKEIQSALRDLCKLNLKEYPQGSDEYNKIKAAYAAASGRLEAVFYGIHRRLYPLLMKLTSSIYYSYETFFSRNRQKILDFLDINEKHLLSKESFISSQNLGSEQLSAIPGNIKNREQQEQLASHKKKEEERHAEIKQRKAKTKLRGAYKLLDELFPGAGFPNLDEFPDLYPYFQSIFNFPRGTEFIPANDPLIQIFVLMKILQEFFFSFASIQFRFYRQEEGEPIQFASRLDKLIGYWHRMITELIQNHYIKYLTDYVRQVEKNPAFKTSKYARKTSSDLFWLKRRYLLPHTKMNIIKGSKPTINVRVEKLFDVCRELSSILENVVQDLSQNKDSIDSSGEKIEFAVESLFSKRLLLVMHRRADRPSKANLVRYTYTIIQLLDYLLNKESSHFYSQTTNSVYRTIDEHTDVPCFKVNLLNPAKIMTEYDKSADIRREDLPRHKVSKLIEGSAYEDKLDELISFTSKKSQSFCLLVITVRGMEKLRTKSSPMQLEQFLNKVGFMINASIRNFEDYAFQKGDIYYILLPDTTAKGALVVIKRLLQQFKIASNGRIPVRMALIRYQQKWKKLGFETITQQGLEAISQANSSVLLYDSTSGTYKPLN